MSDELFGRRASDREGITVSLATLQATVTTGFREVNGRLDYHSNALKAHEASDREMFGNFGRDIRVLQDERLRTKVAAEEAAVILGRIAEEQRARGDRNLKILTGFMSAVGVVVTVVLKFT